MTNAANLTAREAQVWAYIAAGLQSKVISYEMGISENAVKVYTTGLFGKMGFDNRAQAALAWHGCDIGRALSAGRSAPPVQRGGRRVARQLVEAAE